MEYPNVTLSIPKRTLLRAKHIAVDKGKSLSALIAGLLEEFVEREDEYEEAKRQHLAFLDDAPDLGTHGKLTWKRDQLHERRS